jgi:hypothetical protein
VRGQGQASHRAGHFIFQRKYHPHYRAVGGHTRSMEVLNELGALLKYYQPLTVVALMEPVSLSDSSAPESAIL